MLTAKPGSMQDSTVPRACILQDSSAPFWPSLEIQTWDFLHFLAGYQDWSYKFCGQHSPWCSWCRKWRVGMSVPHHQVSRTIYGFCFSFHPQNFMVASFFQRLLRSSEDMCSRVTDTAVLQQVSNFFSPAWGLLFMLISFPGCCIPSLNLGTSSPTYSPDPAAMVQNCSVFLQGSWFWCGDNCLTRVENSGSGKYCPSHLSASVLVCKSTCLFWTIIKYTVELNEREFITMTDLCLQVKFSPLLHTVQLLWITETSGIPRGISVPFEGQET